MPLIGVNTDLDLDGSQKKWIFGALGIAFVIHLVFACALGWYHIPGLEIPSNHSKATGPFVLKSIEVSPDASVHEVAKLMLEKEIPHVLVVDNGFVKGFVSTFDFVQRLLERA